MSNTQNLSKHANHKTSQPLDSAIAVFNTHEEVEKAIQKLVNADLDLKDFKICGPGYNSNQLEMPTLNPIEKLYNQSEILCRLMGSFYLNMMAEGMILGHTLLIAGPFAWMNTSTYGNRLAVQTLSAWENALKVLIDSESSIPHPHQLPCHFIMMAHGSEEELAKAKCILHGDCANFLHLSKKEKHYALEHLSPEVLG